MTRRDEAGPQDEARTVARFEIDRGGQLGQVTRQSQRWLRRAGLVNLGDGHLRLKPDWTVHLWQLDATNADARHLTVRSGLRRALVFKVEACAGERLMVSLWLLRIHARIDASWWAILGKGRHDRTTP